MDTPTELLRKLLKRERCFHFPPFLARFSFLGYKGASVWSQSTSDTRISVWAGRRIQISTALSCHFLRAEALAEFSGLLYKSLRTLRPCKLQRPMRKWVHVIQQIPIPESLRAGTVLRTSVGILASSLGSATYWQYDLGHSHFLDQRPCLPNSKTRWWVQGLWPVVFLGLEALTERPWVVLNLVLDHCLPMFAIGRALFPARCCLIT